MRMTLLSILLMVAVGLCGCSSSPNKHSIVKDYELYDSGEPKMTILAANYKAVGQRPVPLYSYTSEYFKNGRLKYEQWSTSDQEQVELEFYKNGRLKSEERYWNKEVAFGAYYDEDGRPVKTVGKRLF